MSPPAPRVGRDPDRIGDWFERRMYAGIDPSNPAATVPIGLRPITARTNCAWPRSFCRRLLWGGDPFTAPPLLAIGWECAAKHSTRAAGSVPNTASFRAASRGRVAAGPWLAWRASAAKEGTVSSDDKVIASETVGDAASLFSNELEMALPESLDAWASLRCSTLCRRPPAPWSQPRLISSADQRRQCLATRSRIWRALC